MILMESTFLYSSSLAALTHSTEYAKKSTSKEKRGRDKSFQADIHLSKVFMTHWHSYRTVLLTTYSVIHNSIPPSKELCSKMTLGEVGVSLP